jgi:hypothetical protein
MRWAVGYVRVSREKQGRSGLGVEAQHATLQRDSSRILMFFHGGGYCSGSIQSHRRMVTEALGWSWHGRRRLSPGAGAIHFPRPSMMRSSRGASCGGKASARRSAAGRVMSQS